MLTYPSSGWDDDTRPTGNVEFPETVTYNGTTYTVTGISGTAFYNCTGITSITIPNTITSISLYAFAYCTSLSSFNIPSSVTTLYGDSFIYTAWYNNQLDGVICKDGWCLGYKGTPSGSLVIPTGTSRVANSAFSGCSGFTGTLSLPNSLTVIGGGAFSGCSGLTGSIVIPNSVISIGSSAFSGCSGFAGTLTFGNSLTTIGNYAFSNCTKITGVSSFPNSLVSIGDYAFEHCRKIASALVFPSTLESIGLLAFEGCWLATSVTLPGPSTSIGDYAFRYCTGLVSVNIGANIIPEDAFYNCTSLSSLTLQNTVTQIKDGAFQNCSPLSNVDIPSSVVSIGDFAFANTGLTNVTIPSSVYSLGDGVFKNTAWYNNQPDGAYYASNCCLGYKGDKPTGALTIAANTRLIAGNSFFQCVGLTSVSFPNTLTRICYQAFFGCSGLSSVVLPNSCAHLGYGAFEQCSGLTSISLGEQMAFMAEYAFYNCPNIAEIYSYAITPPWLGYCVFCNTSYSIPVYVPSGSVSSYQSADGWSSFTNYHGIGGTNYYTISVSASPSDGGTVTGGGSYNNGSSCTLTATANSGYTFNNWTENGTVVSTNASYTFTVTGNRTLVANFTANPVYYSVDVTASPSNGGTVNGGGSYQEGSNCTLTAMPATGYSFVRWTKNGSQVSTNPTYSFTVTENASYVAVFEQSTVTHSQELTNGWNWWSSYVELNGSESLTQLENSLGSAGLIIKSRSDGYVESYQYNGMMGWFGSLTSICNEQMYKINMSTGYDAAISGYLTNPSSHPITINSGWNWIGFPINHSVGVTEALSSFSPAINDILKGRNGYTTYYSSNGTTDWYGSLNTLEPGCGYMYQSQSSGTKTLVFQSGRGEATMPNITPEDNINQPEDQRFADNMTVTAVVEIEGEELRSDSHELATFVNGECRGSVRLIYVEPIDRYVAFLTVFGESGDALEFRLTDGMEIQVSTDMLVFTSDGMEGTLASPQVLHFGTLGMGETSAMVRIYPNPVRSKGTLNIALPDTSERLMVEISNMLGVTVFRGEVLVEPTSVARITLPDAVLTGTYVLKATAHDGTVYYGKLVVE